LEKDDQLTQIDGRHLGSEEDLPAALGHHRPGDRVTITYVDRRAAQKVTTVTLAEDPHLEVVPIERLGRPLAPAERDFRDRWLAGR
jgi:PDZ domain-containing secreted protein